MVGKTTRNVWLSSAATLALSSMVLIACGESDVKKSQYGQENQTKVSDATGKTKTDPIKAPLRPMAETTPQALKRERDYAGARLNQPNRKYWSSVPRDPRVIPRMDRERYQHVEQNPVKRVAEAPVSTFSVDVDTGAYANMRRFLKAGRLPPGDSVRVEELVNYFGYKYHGPATKDRPFRVSTEVARTPWNKNTFLLHIGIKGFDVQRADRPPANLVFLVDVSGLNAQPEEVAFAQGGPRHADRPAE